MIVFLFLFSLLFSQPRPTLKIDKCALEEKLQTLGLVDVQTGSKRILVSLKYSTTDNFVGYDVYGCITRAYLQKQASQKLQLAASMLEKERPDLYLLIYDAARPVWAQKILWDSIKKPEHLKHVYVANPKRGSIHNYGCAVDLTICDAKGKPLDMGTAFDSFGNLAQPRMENTHVKNGLLKKFQIDNRKLLRSIMLKAGFGITSSEWWHFNFCSLNSAKSKFEIIP